jgi:4-hydroxybenzoate polyprenyltransferase
MVKFSHSLFALPFAVMAMFMAGRNLEGGLPTWWQGLLIVSCMVLARSVAMTFNRIADAAIDARNPRTRNRAIPAGEISVRSARAFLAVCSCGFVISCGGFWLLEHNRWPLLLAIPVLLVICGYSYTKRFTRWSHFYLGICIGFSPAAAWLAIHPASFGLPACVLMGAVLFWIGGFDIIYACQDVEADRSAGLHSLPLRAGLSQALWTARLCHLLTVGFLLLLWRVGGLGSLYLVGVAVVAVLLVIENALVRADDLSRVNLAFFTVNGVVSVVLGLAAVADVLLDELQRSGG